MSADEIRTQKALVLLECTEAEEKVRELRVQKQVMVGRLRSIAQALESDAGSAALHRQNHGDLLLDSVFDFLEELISAEKQVVVAREKLRQFGMVAK